MKWCRTRGMAIEFKGLQRKLLWEILTWTLSHPRRHASAAGPMGDGMSQTRLAEPGMREVNFSNRL